MNITATHTTTYLYGESVSICHTEVHLTPRSGANQRLISHDLKVTPEPAFSVTRRDYFGNEITCFSIHEPHRTLTITSRSEVELEPEEPPHAGLTPQWEKVRDEVRDPSDEESFRAL